MDSGTHHLLSCKRCGQQVPIDGSSMRAHARVCLPKTPDEPTQQLAPIPDVLRPFLDDDGSPKRLYVSDKLVEVLAEHGCPKRVRSKLWMRCSGADRLAQLSTEAGLYSRLSQSELGPERHAVVMKQINADVRRTSNLGGGAKLASEQDGLRRVLLAFAHEHPDIGYLQGMNYIAAVLLNVFDGDEESAFWMLKSICGHELKHLFHLSSGGLQAETAIFEKLVQRHLPETYEQLQKLHAQDLMWLTPGWLLCLFAQVLPLEVVTRLWDLCFVVRAASDDSGVETSTSMGIQATAATEQEQAKQHEHVANTGATGQSASAVTPVLLWALMGILHFNTSVIAEAKSLSSIAPAVKEFAKTLPTLTPLLRAHRRMGTGTLQALGREVRSMRSGTGTGTGTTATNAGQAANETAGLLAYASYADSQLYKDVIGLLWPLPGVPGLSTPEAAGSSGASSTSSGGGSGKGRSSGRSSGMSNSSGSSGGSSSSSADRPSNDRSMPGAISAKVESIEGSTGWLSDWLTLGNLLPMLVDENANTQSAAATQAHTRAGAAGGAESQTAAPKRTPRREGGEGTGGEQEHSGKAEVAEEIPAGSPVSGTPPRRQSLGQHHAPRVDALAPADAEAMFAGTKQQLWRERPDRHHTVASIAQRSSPTLSDDSGEKENTQPSINGRGGMGLLDGSKALEQQHELLVAAAAASGPLLG